MNRGEPCEVLNGATGEWIPGEFRGIDNNGHYLVEVEEERILIFIPEFVRPAQK